MTDKILACLATGGVAPGINAVIKFTVKYAEQFGFDKVILFQAGYSNFQAGVYSNTVLPPLDEEFLKTLHQKGGCYLGNLKPGAPKAEGDYEKIIHGLKLHHVTHLISPGGDDSIYHASKMAQAAKAMGYNLSQAIIPKTIDDDVNLDPDLPYEKQSRTLGFDSCADFATLVFEGLRANAASLTRFYGYTAMGRHSGRLAYEIGKRGKADLILTKEMFALTWEHARPTSFYQLGFLDLAAIILISNLLKRLGHNPHIPFEHSVILAENICDVMLPGTVHREVRIVDGRKCLADANIGAQLETHLEDYLTEFGHSQKVVWRAMDESPRGQHPNQTDQDLALDCVKESLKLLSNDQGQFVVYKRPDGKIKHAPFSQFIDEAGHGIVRPLPRNIAEELKKKNVLRPKDLKNGKVKELADIANVSEATLLPVALKAVNALFPMR